MAIGQLSAWYLPKEWIEFTGRVPFEVIVGALAGLLGNRVVERYIFSRNKEFRKSTEQMGNETTEIR